MSRPKSGLAAQNRLTVANSASRVHIPAESGGSTARRRSSMAMTAASAAAMPSGFAILPIPAMVSRLSNGTSAAQSANGITSGRSMASAPTTGRIASATTAARPSPLPESGRCGAPTSIAAASTPVAK